VRQRGSRHIGLHRPRKADTCGRAQWRGWPVPDDEQEVGASDAGRTRKKSGGVIRIFRREVGTVPSVDRGM